METTEQWKVYPANVLIRASSYGRIQTWETRNKRWSPVFEPAPSPTGYCYFGHGGKRFPVHQVIARTFLGRCPDGCTVDHGNRVRHDNRLCNLTYKSALRQRANQKVASVRQDSRAVWVWQSDALPVTAVRYSSVSSAAKQLGVDAANLRRVAIGTRHTSEGLVANFASPDEEPIEGEVFRLVRGKFKVSQHGRLVVSRSEGFVYTPKPTPGRGPYVTVGSESVRFHVLVAEAWPEIVGPMPVGPNISLDHKDRDPANNAAINLRWSTQSDQLRNQTRKPTTAQSSVRKRAMYVRPPGGEWILFESQHAAARYVSEQLGVKVRDGQLARYATSSMQGHTIKLKRSPMQFWSFKTAAA